MSLAFFLFFSSVFINKHCWEQLQQASIKFFFLRISSPAKYFSKFCDYIASINCCLKNFSAPSPSTALSRMANFCSSYEVSHSKMFPCFLSLSYNAFLYVLQNLIHKLKFERDGKNEKNIKHSFGMLAALFF